MVLRIEGSWFKDTKGRKVLLRGINLGGSSKTPFPNGATHLPTDFQDHQTVSFIGRPFPIKEADGHFNRLKHWGFNCLRLLTTWEAVEHAGPGQYDYPYLHYLQKIVKIAGDYKFNVFIDFHQDVWSRMTGGDGAPGWTFEKVGLDFTKFGPSGAAKIMQYHYPEDYEAMHWVFNYQRLAIATMFTLFFGGQHFAPKMEIDGLNIQKYLQDKFIGAAVEVAKAVKDCENLLGFDPFNEPEPGFIGIHDLSSLPALRPPGQVFTPFDAIAAGAGYNRKVNVYALRPFSVKPIRASLLNPIEISSWLPERGKIWQEHDIWDDRNGNPRLLNPAYFAKQPDGSKIDFFRDYLKPFLLTFTEGIRDVVPNSMIFIEGRPLRPKIPWIASDPQNVVNASHWYDGFSLYMKNFYSHFSIDTETAKLIFFERNINKFYKTNLRARMLASKKVHNGIPTLLGEFGIPFDMDKKKAYKTKNFSKQIQALSLYYDIIDEYQLHSTLWNYTSDNTNEYGDQWNLEDLSIFSRDQQVNPSNINSGGRAIRGFCRPFPRKIAGKLLSFKFERKKPEFTCRYINNPRINAVTEIYIPEIYFPNPAISINPSGCNYEFDNQVMRILNDNDETVLVVIKS